MIDVIIHDGIIIDVAFPIYITNQLGINQNITLESNEIIFTEYLFNILPGETITVFGSVNTINSSFTIAHDGGTNSYNIIAQYDESYDYGKDSQISLFEVPEEEIEPPPEPIVPGIIIGNLIFSKEQNLVKNRNGQFIMLPKKE